MKHESNAGSSCFFVGFGPVIYVDFGVPVGVPLTLTQKGVPSGKIRSNAEWIFEHEVYSDLVCAKVRLGVSSIFSI